MSGFKLVALLFPFIREMFLGEKSIKLAVKTNKIRVLVVMAVTFCVAWTVYSIPRLIRITTDYVLLERRYNALVASSSIPPDPKKAPILVTKTPLVSTAKAPVAPHSAVVETAATKTLEEIPGPGLAGPKLKVTPVTPFSLRQHGWINGLDEIRKKEASGNRDDQQ